VIRISQRCVNLAHKTYHKGYFSVSLKPKLHKPVLPNKIPRLTDELASEN